MGPMFDDIPHLFGVPAAPILLVVAVTGFVVGMLWLRHLMTIEPEQHWFRATDHRRSRVLPLTAAALVTGILVLGLLALGHRLPFAP